MSRRRRDPKVAAPYPRTARVNQVLREVVAEELERLADVDDRLALATITAVETSADLRQATVFLSSIPGEGEVLDALASVRVHLQHAIGRQVRLKRTPQLVFLPDPAIASGRRVDDILRQLHEVPPAESRSGRDVGAGGNGVPGDARDDDDTGRDMNHDRG
jgi:ribosome-binding factor A